MHSRIETSLVLRLLFNENLSMNWKYLYYVSTSGSVNILSVRILEVFIVEVSVGFYALLRQR